MRRHWPRYDLNIHYVQSLHTGRAHVLISIVLNLKQIFMNCYLSVEVLFWAEHWNQQNFHDTFPILRQEITVTV